MLLPDGALDVGKLEYYRTKINFLLNQSDVHDQKLTPQMLHSDYTVADLQEMERLGVWSFSVIMPLTDDGSWLMVSYASVGQR